MRAPSRARPCWDYRPDEENEEAIQQLKQQGKIRYFRGDRKREVYDRARRIVEDLAIPLDQFPEVALRYTLSDPAVSTIIPGMRSVHHVAAYCAVGDGKGLPPEQVQHLKAHRWVRNFYSD